MEDEVITTSAPESDVVMTANTSPENTAVQETNQTLPPVEGALSENPVTPEQPGMIQAPKTEREAAIDYIEYNKDHSYTNRDNGVANWIRNHYNYDPNVAGTMWVAGKINDVSTQMSFLEATLNESMYDEMDLQKYYFDQNLATARAYAQQKKFETAYGFYRAAQEKALAEGELTGWYMPAEGTYMLGQWTVADEILKDPNASDSDKARAQSVYNSTTKWFEANNITERGIKCLNMMYLEETIRHNKEMENLQEQANEIQRKANEANKAASAASYDLQLREFRYDTAKMELQYGADLDNNGVIGFKNSDFVTDGFEFKDFESIFGKYESTYDWAMANPTQAFMVTNRAYMREVLGDSYNSAHNAYMKGVQDSTWLQAQVESGASNIAGENIDSLTPTKIKSSELSKITTNSALINDATIRIIRTEDNKAQLWVFDKNGTAYQIKDGNIALVNGNTINDVLKSQGLTLDKGGNNYLTFTDDKGKTIEMHIGVKSYSTYDTSVSKTPVENFSHMSKEQYELYSKQEGKGNQMAYGVISTENINQAFTLKTKDDDGNIVYKEVNNNGIKDIKNNSKVLDVHINSDKTFEITPVNGGELTEHQKNYQYDYADLALEQAQYIGHFENKDGSIKQKVYLYTNSDGSTIKFSYGSSIDPKGRINNMVIYTDDQLVNGKKGFVLETPSVYTGAPEGNLPEGQYTMVGKHQMTVAELTDDRTNYINGYKGTTAKTPTATDIVDKDEEDNKEEKADNAATLKTNFNSSDGDTTVRDVEETNNKKNQRDSVVFKKDVEYSDTDFDQLLGNKGNTLFTQEQIEKQIERHKESKKFLEMIQGG